jgi:hypothetical protein
VRQALDDGDLHERHGDVHGGAVQVDPMKPTLKPPGSKRLKLYHEKLLSNFAFNFNLRRYIMVLRAKGG